MNNFDINYENDINIHDIKNDDFKNLIIKKLYEQKKRENEAAIIIQRASHKKYNSNKIIAKLLCNNSPYRDSSLKSNVKDNKLQYMYLHNCKLNKINFNEFSELINNVVFINTDIINSNFTGINFKLCKFYNLKSHEPLLQNYVNNHRTTTDRRQFNINIFSLSNSILDNTTFTKCYFYNIHINDISLNSNKTIVFDDCTFDNWCQFDFPDFKIINETNDTTTQNDNNIEIFQFNYNNTSDDSITINNNGGNCDDILFELYKKVKYPNIIFINCKFNRIFFNNKNTALIHFKNCTFVDANFGESEINFVQFTNCSFQQCGFLKSKFVGTTIKNCNFINTIFNNTTFSINYQMQTDKMLSQLINTSFNNCKFIGVLFHNYFHPCYTCIIHPDCIFNNSFFIKINCIGFKFNKYSLLLSKYSNYKSNNSKTILNMKNNHFQLCQIYGTNFDDCDLNNCNFNISNNIPNYFNWYGKMFIIYHGTTIFYGKDKTLTINPINYDSIFNDIQISNKMTHPTISNNSALFYLKYTEYPQDLLKIINESIEPYDYFKHKSYTFQILPATSFKNANIKGCNFQQAEGLQSFNFNQVNNHDLTSVNFTFVDLTNANFNKCILRGTIFQIADIKGANFLDCEVNDNTDFENTQNIVLAQNTDNINFGELQNNANETHAKSVHTINAKDKLIDFFSINKLLRYPSLESLIQDFTSTLSNAIQNIYNDTFTESIQDTIKEQFTQKILTILSNILNYNQDDKSKLTQDLNTCFSTEVIRILCSKYIKDGKPWCWLELVMYSMIFLFNNTRTYIFIFLQTYFNEVFNAHGQGSTSCSLGMVERLVNIHSATSEIYISCFCKSRQEIEMILDSDIDKLQQFNPANPTTKDTVITKDWINNFNFPEQDVDFASEQFVYDTIDTKYTYHKLINLLNIKADLPLKSSSTVEDIIIDYDITQDIRNKWHNEISIMVNDNKITTLEEVLNHYVDFIIKYKYEQYNLNPKTIDVSIKQKFDRYKKHLEDVEKNILEQDLLYMCDQIINKETLTEYFSGGFSRRVKSTNELKSQRRKSIRKIYNINKPRSTNELKLQRRISRRRIENNINKPRSFNSFGSLKKSSLLTIKRKKILEIDLLKAIFSIDKNVFLKYFEFNHNEDINKYISKDQDKDKDKGKGKNQDKISIVSIPSITYINYNHKYKYEIKQYWNTIYSNYIKMISNNNMYIKSQIPLESQNTRPSQNTTSSQKNNTMTKNKKDPQKKTRKKESSPVSTIYLFNN